MRIRRLQARARPFRYAGFWLTATVWLLLIGSGREGLQIVVGGLFCLVWPVLADVVLRRLPPAGGSHRAEQFGYVAECALVALVLGWASLPPLPALTTTLWLLGGAASLAGWRLTAAASAAGLSAGWLGHLAAPAVTAVSTGPVDVLALMMLAAFVLALGFQSFQQAQRLDAQRLLLVQRSAELERVNRRLQRYLPRSLSERVREAPETLWRWERRWLTVIFIDLAGFTRLADRLDAESLATLVDDYFGTLVPAVERRRGEVSKLMGDGMLAVFDARSGGRSGGDDEARRTCALQALTLCREAPGLVASVAERWRERGERIELSLRAGMASGLCTLGDRGGSDRLDFTLIGTPVNLASRLQACARANGTLMDEATALLCRSSVDLEGPMEIHIRGLGSIPAFAAEAV